MAACWAAAAVDAVPAPQQGFSTGPRLETPLVISVVTKQLFKKSFPSQRRWRVILLAPWNVPLKTGLAGGGPGPEASPRGLGMRPRDVKTTYKHLRAQGRNGRS
ncbi:uncharacterized protein AAEQ78_003876 isoform 2-T5 [Lycaon pictus]